MCDALSVGMLLDEDGALVNADVCASRVRAKNRLSYGDVDSMLRSAAKDDARVAAGEKPMKQRTKRMDELSRIQGWADRRRAYRRARGCADIYFDQLPYPEVQARRTPDALDGYTVHARPSRDTSAANTLVTEMMILAGEAVARCVWRRRCCCCCRWCHACCARHHAADAATAPITTH